MKTRRFFQHAMTLAFVGTLPWLGACSQSASKPVPSNTPSGDSPQAGRSGTVDRGTTDEPDACDELLKSLFDVFRIDKFETTFDVSIGANRMNDWYRGCALRTAAETKPNLPPEAERLFSGAQLALMSGDQYRTRDASHVRDCVLFSAVANRIMKSPQTAGQTELDRARAAFDHVVATLQLQPRHSADLPFTPYELYLLGKGTASDRAWLFVNTLRALRIDSVVLIPANAEDPGMSGDATPLLVAVPIEGELYLFDPALGIPIPGPDSEKGGLRPATLKQVQAQPELLSNLGSEQKPYAWTSAELAQPAVLFVGDLSYYSSSAKALQQVFAGEHSVLVSDPLEDIDRYPGLWSRLIAAGKGAWTADSLRLWKYPQDQVTRSLALDDEGKDRRKSLKLRFMAYLVATPIPEMPGKFVVSGSKESRDPTMKGLDSRDAGVGGFARTESRTTSGRQMEGRLSHVAGNLSDALRAYVEVQSNSREILQIPDNNLLMDKRLGPINVKLFHALAIDDAVYWSGLCQLEQGQFGPAANTFERYLRQANRVSEWTRQARRMKGIALAAQGKFAEAAQSLEEISEDDPEAPGLRQLAKAWKAAAGS